MKNEHEQLTSKEQNRLRHLRLRFSHMKDAWLSCEPSTQQHMLADIIIASTNGNDAFAQELMLKQVGDPSWQLSSDELEGLSERAITAIVNRIQQRSKALWPWLLYDKGGEIASSYGISYTTDYGKLKDEFMGRYLEAADTLGLFPNTPSLQTVPLQRALDSHVRTTAAEIMFVENCIKTPVISEAAKPILGMIYDAAQAYSRYDIQTLQQTVIQKANLSPLQIGELQQDGLWHNASDLKFMCTDKGLRDVVLNHYGIMRDVRLPDITGYGIGQELLANKSIIQRCMRVAG